MNYQKRLGNLLSKYSTHYSTPEANPTFIITKSRQETAFNVIGNSLFFVFLGLGYKYSERGADYVAEVIKKRENRDLKQENPNQYIAAKVFFTGLFVCAAAIPTQPIVFRLCKMISKK